MAISLSIAHRGPISPYEQYQTLDRCLLERSEQPISDSHLSMDNLYSIGPRLVSGNLITGLLTHHHSLMSSLL